MARVRIQHRGTKRRKPVDQSCPECGGTTVEIFRRVSAAGVFVSIRCNGCKKERTLAPGETLAFQCGNPGCEETHIVTGTGEVVGQDGLDCEPEEGQ